MAKLGVDLHYLATWRDVLTVARAHRYFPEDALNEIESFIADPKKGMDLYFAGKLRIQGEPMAVSKLVKARKTATYGALLAGANLSMRLNWHSWKQAVVPPMTR